jgi:hypothetical protein
VQGQGPILYGNLTKSTSDVQTGYHDGAMVAKNFTTCLNAAGTQSQSQFCNGFLTAWNDSTTCQATQFQQKPYCLGYNAGFNATITSGEK